MQNIQFKPGILEDILELMKTKAATMEERDKNAILLVDEMSIKESIDYCNKADELVGGVTLPNHTGSATKAFVGVICGLGKRWKQTVFYHMT